jgi:hypothetical protein
MISFFGEWAKVSIEEIMFLIEGTEQVFASSPFLERHQVGVQLIFVKLDYRTRMEEDSVEV